MELISGVALDYNAVISQKDPMKRKLKVLPVLGAAFLLVGGFIIATSSTTTNHKICQCSPDKHCGCGNNCRCK
jgi:hypothetical protein